MKKFLLLAAVAICAASANAQQLSSKELPLERVKMQRAYNAVKPVFMEKVESVGATRSVETNFWYQPDASMPSYGFTIEGRGYYPAIVVPTAFEDFKLVNKADNPEKTKWLINGEDVTELADEEGNFVYNLKSGYQLYMPTMSNGSLFKPDSFNWYDLVLSNYAQNSTSAFVWPQSGVAPLTWSDPHINKNYWGTGYLSSQYIFGKGEVENEGSIYSCYAYAQVFAKPMSPMYVEDIFIGAVCFNTLQPVAEGEDIIMEIVNNETDELIAELTCTPNEVVWDYDETGEPYSFSDNDLEVRPFTAVFSQKVEDSLSGELASAPFVIDAPFTVYIYYTENSNFGFYGHENPDAVEAVGNGYNLVVNTADQNDMVAFRCGFGSNNYVCAPISFNAFFDNVKVWKQVTYRESEDAEPITLDDFNVLNVSADGQTMSNAAYPQFNALQANTASPWFDEDENENYYFDVKEGCEYPEWILTFGVDNSSWDSTDNFDPVVAFAPQVDPLPANVKGRGVKLYVCGRGCVSDEPVYILQGEYTKEQCDADEDAANIGLVEIDKTVRSDKAFNLMGQPVDNSYKGFVVRNGVKMLQK